MGRVDLAIYVGSLDYFWEWEWLTGEPYPTRPIEIPVAEGLEGLKVTYFPIKDDRQVRRKKISDWRDRMRAELGEWLKAPLDWDETDRRHAVAVPNRKCWASLMLWATHAEFHEKPPAVAGFDDVNHQTFARLRQLPNEPRFRQIVQCIDYWLPAPFDTVLGSDGPVDDSAWIGSSPVLLAQLEALNAETWKADRATIQRWSEAGEPTDGMLESEARYAFAELLLAAQYSCDSRMPMKYYLDESSLSPNPRT